MRIGIIAQAQKAKKQNEISEKEEETRLLALEAASNYNGKTHTEKDASGNVTASVYIPAGFAMTGRDGESTVEEGLVVIDSYGNEYVWIPVFEKSATRTCGVDYSAVTTPKTAEKAKFTTADYTNIETALKAYTATYKHNDYSDTWYGDSTNATHGYYNGSKFIYYTNGNMSQTEYETLYHNMLVSVYKNGGFYIGRYEMGTGVATSVETAQSLTRTEMTEYYASQDINTSTTVRTNAAPSIAGMPTPVSKANAVGYTEITQSQAQMLAKKMGEVYGYGTTTSSLMFGVQWDAVCVYLEKYGSVKI